MGGFHGGHSGGHSGGFHGGSHHSSHSSGGGYHHHSHHVVGGVHYIDGRRHYGPYYGMSGNGKPISFFTSLIVGIVFIFIGLIVFLSLSTPRTATAVITKTSMATDTETNQKYEVYDFEYEVGGKTYTGYGDDDLTASGDYSILEGEKYTIHVHLLNPADYSFNDQTPLAAIIGGIFWVIGLALSANTIRVYIAYKKKLKEVGDANGDGIVNEKDIEYADKKESGMADGAYDGARDATAENVYNEMKKDTRKVCPYCDSFVAPDANFCVNCGGKLTESK
ncbi:MAG: zinc ribbon domain-containing protein [Acholeplasmatales bacterium]|nr:zinc ribbon domain-containing protein [Acholeplasmatales bacterium]